MIWLCFSYIPATDKVTMSTTKFKLNSLGRIGKFSFMVLKTLRLINVSTDEDGYTEINNLTIINLTLKFLGDQHEAKLTTKLLLFQVFRVVAGEILIIGFRYSAV